MKPYLNFSLIIKLVVLLVATSEMATDIYAPSLPEISRYFNVSDAQLTISLNLFGFAFSSLFYGALSDHYGRRPLILTGISIFVIASIICWQANTFSVLLWARLLQGLGAGSALALGLAVIRDLFSGEQCAKIISKIGMVIALSPGLAPIFGGYIGSFYGWRSVFLIIVIFSIVLWLLLYFKLPETLIEKPQGDFSFTTVFQGYKRLACNHVFVAFMMIQFMTIAGLWAELANLPFLYINDMGIKAYHYGYFAAAAVGSYVLGTIANQKWVSIFGMKRMLGFGISLVFFSRIMLLVINYFVELSPVYIQLVETPGAFGLGLIFGNATTYALESAGKDSGAAAAFLGTAEMLGGGIGVYLVAVFYNATIVPIAIMTAITAFINLLIFFYGMRSKKLECISIPM
jgi:DHA1 family bicyclomycin/chloramphenicol resistance-like MFS transporter